jgi:adenine-specific DNA methylase
LGNYGDLNLRYLVESWLPLRSVNDTARVEAGFIRAPKLSNIHPYLARRPTAPARILTLASVLPEAVPREKFIRAVGLDKIASAPFKLLYLVNPNRDYLKDIVKKYTGRDPSQIVVVDPMAGGGSIPLEALRLGFKTIAIDYNPVAYILLKATLEYPAKYGSQLYEDVKKEVEKLIEWVRKELTQYYSSDAQNYIIARGYRCPNCRGVIPIIHDTRLGKGGPYIKFTINKDEKSFRVEVSGSAEPFERLRCPYCDTPINEGVTLKNWVKKHKELLEIVLSGDVKRAKEKIDELLETHIILVKETPQGFRPADDVDKQGLIKAYLDLASQINELREYLPDAQIPKENGVFEPIRGLGIEYWWELFNPRQLLVLLKLMKYVRERTVELIKEKGEYGAAIALYLAIGIDKFLDFNNIATYWAYSVGAIRPLKEHYSNTRQISLNLEYCEMPPVTSDPGKSLGWVFEPHITRVAGTAGGVLPVVRVLSEWLSGLGNLVDVICGDARNLSRILRDRGIERVDVVNVDPPYLAQHFYSNLMEFFWQFLRIMLQPAIDEGFLFNRDPARGKVELYIENWSPYLPTLPREVEIIARRGKDEIKDLSKMEPELVERTPFTGNWYVLKMWEFFGEVDRTLKDDGVLIVWFTHSDPRAWEAIVASAYAAGFALSKAWTIWTEMVPGRGLRPVDLTSAFLTSLALVFRKRSVLGSITIYSSKAEDIIRDEEVRRIIRQSVIEDVVKDMNSEASGPEIFIMALASGIASATKIWSPSIDEIKEQDISKIRSTRFKKALRLFDNVLYPAAMYIALEALLEDYLAKNGLDESMRRDALFTDNISRVYLMLWTASRYAETRDLAYDFIEKVCKIMNIDIDALTKRGLLRGPLRSGGHRRLLFGSECYGAVRNKMEVLVATNVGKAIHVLKLIGEMERKEDATKAAQNIASRIPLSRSVIVAALYLLRTATREELKLIEIQNDIIKRFAENVLLTLYKGL